MKRRDHDKTNPYKTYRKEKSSEEKFKLVDLFYKASPFTKNITTNHELEVKFGTRGFKHFSKIDYDNVIKKLKSVGFFSANEQGNYLLRAENEFLDSKTGKFRNSDIRTEISGFQAIQAFCKANDINVVKNSQEHTQNVQFVKKAPVIINGEKVWDENFDDFKFRLSYKTEETMSATGPIIRNLTESWVKIKKSFRYINRVSFTHADYPVWVDMSIVKSSSREGREYKKTYTTDEANVFSNPESYEIEIEVDNSRIGPSTEFNSAAKIVIALRKCIKYILCGLQGTNYPISYPEQQECLQNYMQLLYQDKYNPEKRVYPSDFVGPSSYTLQLQNISPMDDNTNVPNIRKEYIVTDKADGERNLLYISGKGRLYLINTNMEVIFTGVQTAEKTVFYSLLDGELISHDKGGKFINLYAAFDLYYVGKEDSRSLPFVPIPSHMLSEKEMEKKLKDREKKVKSTRYALLKKLLSVLAAESVVPGELCPMRIEAKRFYPEFLEIEETAPKEQANKKETDEAIFRACKTILSKEENGLFEYHTDGLIFTPAYLGVGSSEIGKSGKLYKTTWEYSFKWKPAQFNTIDFLVTTKKRTDGGEDMITPVFQEGMNISSTTELSQYKTLILRCGFDESKHGYMNPCQDVIEDNLPEFGNMDNEDNYRPVQFYPTDPYDAKAGICCIMLKKDDTDVYQMFTEEGEVFQDNTIVEFSYDLTIEDSEWRWKPLRVRYDKTAELRQGLKNFGNAYHVANSNWKSIHNPITSDMITSGTNIPEMVGDEDVYYNRTSSSTKTRGLRDFHNLFVKRLLIKSVSKRGDTLIDYACGKGGDFSKWIYAQLSFVFGIDISKDNLENRMDGACTRFLNNRRKFKHVPYALFVNGTSAQNIRSGEAMLNDKAIQITKAVFGEGAKDVASLGKGVIRQYGKGQDGFQISSCQFALHYFFENMNTLQNFLINLAECTALGGYFIGASYDGKTVFQMLRGKSMGDGVSIVTEDGVKVWEIKKQYEKTEFPENSTSLGYKIDVYQESINKLIPEYLVNYDYLNRVMEDYGFQIVSRDEAKTLGLPEGSGLFNELFQTMLDEVKMNKFKEKEYGSAAKMDAYEKKISFLNRYFVYKKVRNVNAKKVVLEEDENVEEIAKEKVEKSKNKSKSKPKSLEKEKEKPKVKKLKNKLVLTEDASSSAFVPVNEKEEEPEEKKEPEPTDKDEEPKSEPENKKSVPKKKKIKLIIQDD
jgi:hypothetical protein